MRRRLPRRWAHFLVTPGALQADECAQLLRCNLDLIDQANLAYPTALLRWLRDAARTGIVPEPDQCLKQLVLLFLRRSIDPGIVCATFESEPSVGAWLQVSIRTRPSTLRKRLQRARWPTAIAVRTRRYLRRKQVYSALRRARSVIGELPLHGTKIGYPQLWFSSEEEGVLGESWRGRTLRERLTAVALEGVPRCPPGSADVVRLLKHAQPAVRAFAFARISFWRL